MTALRVLILIASMVVLVGWMAWAGLPNIDDNDNGGGVGYPDL